MKREELKRIAEDYFRDPGSFEWINGEKTHAQVAKFLARNLMELLKVTKE